MQGNSHFVHITRCKQAQLKFNLAQHNSPPSTAPRALRFSRLAPVPTAAPFRLEFPDRRWEFFPFGWFWFLDGFDGTFGGGGNLSSLSDEAILLAPVVLLLLFVVFGSFFLSAFVCGGAVSASPPVVGEDVSLFGVSSAVSPFAEAVFSVSDCCS